MTVADQLRASGATCKTYQESLPASWAEQRHHRDVGRERLQQQPQPGRHDRGHQLRGARGVKSAQPYNHQKLLRTLEAGFGLGCLNHACDSNVQIMSDVFGREQRR